MDLNVWVQRVRDHLAFLQQAGANPQNFDQKELVTSIHLYRLLLPFVFEYGEKNVWLPENVLFVFHCHLMRPASFAYDCQKSFKSFVRFNPHADKLPEKARNFTKGVFFARYGFAFDEYIDVHLADVPSNFSPTEDLIAEALKLRQFTENAASYSGILDLVEDSLQGYLRFFECVSRGTLAITRLPSLAVDIIWHTHLWYNEEYILFSEERTRKLIVDHREPCARGLNFARLIREKNYVVNRKHRTYGNLMTELAESISVVITYCLQKDFFDTTNDSTDYCIVDTTSSLLSIGKQETQRILGLDHATGPMLSFINWVRSQESHSFQMLHIRGHGNVNKEDFGDTLRDNELSKLILDLDAQVEQQKNERYINVTTFNAFYDTDLETILTELISRYKHVKIGVLGLWTDTTLSFLLYELRTRFRHVLEKNNATLHLATCSSLTASNSRVQHYNSLQQLSKILKVEVLDSVSDFQEFLLPEWWKCDPNQREEPNQLSTTITPTYLRSCDRLWSALSQTDKEKLTDIDKQIIAFLLRDSTSVKLKKLVGGFSGSWVFSVSSKDMMGHQQATSILKLGRRAAITRERVNFEKVEGVLGLNAPALRSWCECKDRAGLTFAYASMSSDGDDNAAETPSFRSLYIRSLTDDAITLQHIQGVLHKVFRIVLGRFYNAALMEKMNLFDAYDFDGRGWSTRTGGSDTPSVVMERVKRLLPNNCDEQYDFLHFSKDVVLPNVSIFLDKILPLVKKSYLAKLGSFVSIVHGDLNGRNILVDPNSNVWLIDYEYTEHAHILKDVLKLESDILYEYTLFNNEDEMQQGISIVQALAKVDDLSQPLSPVLSSLTSEYLIRAWDTIVYLRAITSELVRDNSAPFQLDLVMLRYSLFAMTMEHFSDRQRTVALAAACGYADNIKRRYERNIAYRVSAVPGDYNLYISIAPGRIDRGGNITGELEVLKKEGIKNIVFLYSDHELSNIAGDMRVYAVQQGMELLMKPVSSRFSPSITEMKQMVAWVIERTVKRKEKLCIVSCSGLGRCSTLACCVALTLNKMLTPNHAVELMKQARGPRAIDSERQFVFVQKYYQELHAQ